MNNIATLSYMNLIIVSKVRTMQSDMSAAENWETCWKLLDLWVIHGATEKYNENSIFTKALKLGLRRESVLVCNGVNRSLGHIIQSMRREMFVTTRSTISIDMYKSLRTQIIESFRSIPKKATRLIESQISIETGIWFDGPAWELERSVPKLAESATKITLIQIDTSYQLKVQWPVCSVDF